MLHGTSLQHARTSDAQEGTCTMARRTFGLFQLRMHCNSISSVLGGNLGLICDDIRSLLDPATLGAWCGRACIAIKHVLWVRPGCCTGNGQM